ncbi:hypothetical protein [Halopenitus persicus]|uniref:Uncharacterized protein n=1 Tax=Halopenitus persicus TaxID=1048396 RepID=A0A1H3E3L9_9EURY|nr:hypothetical protein [Halopenitus persicus]SDX73207.1 hypothetical protein SAMN05216564_101270 [Halopenitus persicus]
MSQDDADATERDPDVTRVRPLDTATAGREEWSNTTPTDAGDSLFGPMRTEGHEDEAARSRS